MKYLSFLLLFMSTSLFARPIMQIEVPPGQQQFTISLPANPSTGYQWSIMQYDKSLLHMAGSRYTLGNTKLIGAGGQMHYVFTVNAGDIFPFKTVLKFKYSRSWEKNSGDVQKVIVRFAS